MRILNDEWTLSEYVCVNNILYGIFYVYVCRSE